MAKAKTRDPARDAHLALTKNTKTIDSWALEHIFMPILMSQENKLTALKRLVDMAELPYETRVINDGIEAFYNDDHPIKFIFRLNPIELRFDIVAEYKWDERVFCDFHAVVIGTFFKLDLDATIKKAVADILRIVKK